MNFWFPGALVFLALAPIIVLVHLLRRKRTRLLVPSILLWTRHVSPQKQNPGWRKIGNLIALFVSLLILLLMVFALARPDLRGWSSTQSTLLVVDARLRMHATAPDGESAFDRAIDAAVSVARRASANHPVGLMVFPDGPILPFLSEPKALIESLSALKPTDASGDLTNAVEQTLAAQKDVGRVIVLTDREIPELSNPRVSVHAVGSPRENAAVTAFHARPSANAPGMTDVFLRVTNFAESEAKTSVQLFLDSKLIDVRELTLEPDGSAEIRLNIPTSDLRAAEAGVLEAMVSVPDALIADNRAQIVFPTGDSPRVLVVSEQDGFIEKAISADPGISYELLRPSAWRPEFGGAFPVIVFDGWTPPAFDEDQWSKGNYLFVGAAPGSMQVPEVSSASVTVADLASPLFKGIKLEGLTIHNVRPLVTPAAAGWEPALKSDTKTLLLTYQNPSDPSVRSVILAFVPEASDFPQRAAFPLFVSNCLHWLLGIAPPATLLAGKEAPSYSGVYPIGSIYGISSPAAVNPDARAESDVRLASRSAPIAGASPSPISPVFWEILVVAAILLLVCEGIAFHRRWLT